MFPDIAKLTATASAFALFCGVVFNYSLLSMLDPSLTSLISIQDHISSAIPVFFLIIPFAGYSLSSTMSTSILGQYSNSLARLFTKFAIPIYGKRYETELLEAIQKFASEANSGVEGAAPSNLNEAKWTDEPRKIGRRFLILIVLPIPIAIMFGFSFLITKLISSLLLFIVYSNVLTHFYEKRFDMKTSLLYQTVFPTFLLLTSINGFCLGDVMYWSTSNDIAIFLKDKPSSINTRIVRAMSGGIITFNTKDKLTSYYLWSQIEHFERLKQ